MDEKIKYRRERDSMESLTKQLSAEIEGGVKWIIDKSFMEKEIKRLKKDLNYEKTIIEQRAKECLRLNTMLRNSKGGLEILQKEVLFLKGIFENDGRKEEIERLWNDFREKEQEREKEELNARKDDEEVEIVNITCPSEDLSEEEIDEHMLNKEIDSLMEDIETAEKDKESSCERAKEQNADDERNKKSGRERAKGKKKTEEKEINGRKAAEEKGKKGGRKGVKEKEKEGAKKRGGVKETRKRRGRGDKDVRESESSMDETSPALGRKRKSRNDEGGKEISKHPRGKRRREQTDLDMSDEIESGFADLAMEIENAIEISDGESNVERHNNEVKDKENLGHTSGTSETSKEPYNSDRMKQVVQTEKNNGNSQVSKERTPDKPKTEEEFSHIYDMVDDMVGGVLPSSPFVFSLPPHMESDGERARFGLMEVDNQKPTRLQVRQDASTTMKIVKVD